MVRVFNADMSLIDEVVFITALSWENPSQMLGELPPTFAGTAKGK